MNNAQGYTHLSLKHIIVLVSGFPLFAYLKEFLHEFIISVLQMGPIPKHVAFIMDGNRRYAKNRKVALKDGHSAGAEALIKVLNTCYALGVAHATIYAFSIENFNRSQLEIDTLFGLLRDKLQMMSKKDSPLTKNKQIKIRIVGNRDMIPADILADLEEIEKTTNKPTAEKVLNVCFPYTSRDDITHSIKRTAQKLANKEIDAKENINLRTLNSNMYMGEDTPPLDILIRTSGYNRLSDFMLWQCNSNCMIEFVSTLWPDFKFLSTVAVIMKWSYYETLRKEETKLSRKAEKEKPKLTSIDLKSLKIPPPLASVTHR